MTDETAETICEVFERLVAGNPRFIQAPQTGLAFAITGARPTVGDAATADAGQAAPAAIQREKTSEA